MLLLLLLKRALSAGKAGTDAPLVSLLLALLLHNGHRDSRHSGHLSAPCHASKSASKSARVKSNVIDLQVNQCVCFLLLVAAAASAAASVQSFFIFQFYLFLRLLLRLCVCVYVAVVVVWLLLVVVVVGCGLGLRISFSATHSLSLCVGDERQK